MASDARIGYPPARVWGCPTTAMWVYRLGAQRAKRMLLTGDTIDGTTAAEWGLALEAVPAAELDARVEALADRIAGVPTNQLVMQKLMINSAYESMGLANTQVLATLFDGITRHSPEGRWFKDFAERDGVPTPRSSTAIRGDRSPTAAGRCRRKPSRSASRAKTARDMRQIIAFGGGGFSMEPDNPLLDDYILTRARRGRPARLLPADRERRLHWRTACASTARSPSATASRPICS